jgi:putative selenate reductase
VAILRPLPLASLVRRVLREVEEKGAIFDLPVRRFVRGRADHDLSVELGGRRASAPFGPAAGPHTQLAQNMVLSWLAGGRVLELKTVQVRDALVIPRPCIDMRDVGLNCEWSQELGLAESLDEYVKGALLIAMIAKEGSSGALPGSVDTIFDASVGYDLAGVQSEAVSRFLRGLRDTGPTVDRLRRALPPALARRADVELPKALVETVTLSTFHGCPPSEIESIARHLMETYGVGCVVKLNPTLLGKARIEALLHDALGYDDLRVPEHAFERDLRLDEASALVTRLAERARELGVHFGVKLTNTLVVENRRDFFPRSVDEAYLSGAPLHVLAIDLLRELRARHGDLAFSFSGGIDAQNVADAIALDLSPVTVCTDWLKTGGYGRGIRYAEAIHQRMDLVGAKTRDALVLTAFGRAERAIEKIGIPAEARARALTQLRDAGTVMDALSATERRRWVREAALQNTEIYAARVVEDPRYRRAHHERPPRKVGSRLALFDCLTCDKCIPVCPNDANFALVVPHVALPRWWATPTAGGWRVEQRGIVRIDERHQLAHFADSCNDCGNCDVFCPEDGGPQLEKPRFFGSLASLRSDPHGSGLYVERRGAGLSIWGRFSGREVRLEVDGPSARFEGAGFRVRFDLRAPEGTLEGEADAPIDLTEATILHTLASAALAPREVNPVSTHCDEPEPEPSP